MEVLRKVYDGFWALFDKLPDINPAYLLIALLGLVVILFVGLVVINSLNRTAVVKKASKKIIKYLDGDIVIDATNIDDFTSKCMTDKNAPLSVADGWDAFCAAKSGYPSAAIKPERVLVKERVAASGIGIIALFASLTLLVTAFFSLWIFSIASVESAVKFFILFLLINVVLSFIFLMINHGQKVKASNLLYNAMDVLDAKVSVQTVREGSKDAAGILKLADELDNIATVAQEREVPEIIVTTPLVGQPVEQTAVAENNAAPAETKAAPVAEEVIAEENAVEALPAEEEFFADVETVVDEEPEAVAEAEIIPEAEIVPEADEVVEIVDEEAIAEPIEETAEVVMDEAEEPMEAEVIDITDEEPIVEAVAEDVAESVQAEAVEEVSAEVVEETNEVAPAAAEEPETIEFADAYEDSDAVATEEQTAEFEYDETETAPEEPEAVEAVEVADEPEVVAEVVEDVQEPAEVVEPAEEIAADAVVIDEQQEEPLTAEVVEEDDADSLETMLTEQSDDEDGDKIDLSTIDSLETVETSVAPQAVEDEEEGDSYDADAFDKLDSDVQPEDGEEPDGDEYDANKFDSIESVDESETEPDGDEFDAARFETISDADAQPEPVAPQAAVEEPVVPVGHKKFEKLAAVLPACVGAMTNSEVEQFTVLLITLFKKSKGNPADRKNLKACLKAMLPRIAEMYNH